MNWLRRRRKSRLAMVIEKLPDESDIYEKAWKENPIGRSSPTHLLGNIQLRNIQSPIFDFRVGFVISSGRFPTSM